MTKKEKDIISFYVKVFGSDEGKMVLEDIGKMAFSKTSAFNSNPYTMARNIGRQELYMDICFIVEEGLKPKKRQEKAEENQWEE